MPVLQAKLEVGPPDDRFEQEAERVADQVMRMADPQRTDAIDLAGAAPDDAQRLCPECEEEVRRQPAEKEEELRMKRASGAMPEIGAGLWAQISGLRGGGQPLPPPLRTFFEPRFGHDFSRVRIHRDARSAELARALNARAFTVGYDVVFGRGGYAPGTGEGKRLVAHELAHLVQRVPQSLIRRQPVKPCTNYLNAEATIRSVKETLPADLKYGMYIGTIGKGDNFNKIAARSLQEHPETLKATVGQLTDELVTLNHRLATPTTLQEGQCVVLLREWAHPNVGDVGRALQIVREPSGKSIKNDLIATVYAEQSGSKIDDVDIQNSLDEQREYILYSILRRVEGLEWSSSIANVLDPAQYHGKQEGNEAYINHYKPAMEYLTSEPPSKPVNSTAIEQIKTLVETLRSDKIPDDAGPYYFHWSAQTTTAERVYQQVLGQGASPDVAEKKAAYKHAKDVVGAPMSGISESQGWLKKIPGKNKGRDNERYGSMYIFR